MRRTQITFSSSGNRSSLIVLLSSPNTGGARQWFSHLRCVDTVGELQSQIGQGFTLALPTMSLRERKQRFLSFHDQRGCQKICVHKIRARRDHSGHRPPRNDPARAAAQFLADGFTAPKEKQKRAFQAQKQPSQSPHFSFRNCLILNSDLSRTGRS